MLIGNWCNRSYVSSDKEHEEPYEARVSRTVLWEGWGEIPLPDPIIFIAASDQVRVGRAQNYLEAEHVNQIFDWYKAFGDVGNYVKVASLDDLKENDFNLNIPLYVEKIIEDNLLSVEEALADLKTALDTSLKEEDKFRTILKNYI